MYFIEYSNDINTFELLLQKNIDINEKDIRKNTLLHYACKYNNVDALASLLKKKPKINEKNFDGLTPLMISAIKGNWLCSKLLLEHPDINVNIANKNNKNLLYFMVENSIEEKEIYDELFKHGAYFSSNLITKKTFFEKIIKNNELKQSIIKYGVLIENVEKKIFKKYNSLTFAIISNKITFLKSLLELGADPNEKDDDQNIPLIIAIKNNNLEAIKLLIEYNANYIEDEQKILHWASNCNKEILSYIIEIQNKNKGNIYYNNNSSYLIFNACENENIKDLKNLIENQNVSYKINYKNSDGLTPLLYSIQNGKYESAECILEVSNYVDANIPDSNGDMPFDFIIKNKIQNMFNIIEKLVNRGGYVDSKYFNKSLINLIIDNKDIIRYFIEKGIPIKNNKKDRMFIVPNSLIFAVKQDCYPFVKALLENGSSVDEIDSDHKTPLIYAIDNDNKAIIDLLLKYKTDINKIYDNNNELTPIIYTVQKNNSPLFNYLFSKVSNESDKKQIITSIIEYSLNNKSLEMIDFVTNNSSYDLNLISNIISCLLKEGKINLKSENDNNNTLLHYICFKGNQFLIKEFINCHQDFNILNSLNMTPLMLSIIHKKYDCAKYLLSEFSLINVNYMDIYGETAMTYLLKNQDYDEEIIELFYDKGLFFTIEYFKNDSLLKYITKCIVLLKIFIEKGIYFKDMNDNLILISTPLIFSVKNNIKSLLISLLNLKANVNEIDEKDKSALYYAINNNDVDTINILLNFNANINQEIMKGKTPFIYTIENKKINIFMHLIQNKNIQDNFNAVIKHIYNYAYRTKNYDIFTFVINQLEDKYDIYYPLIDLLKTDGYDIYEVNKETGWNLLHYSSYIGNLKLLNILLDDFNFTKLNIKCIDGSTPLMLSIKNGKFECASKLMENKLLDVNIKDNDGYSPLSYMVKHNDMFNEYIFDSLILRGAYLPVKYFEDTEYLKYIINNKTLIKKITYKGINVIDENLVTTFISQPLFYAVQNNNKLLALEFIKNGAKINEIDQNNNNALVYAIKNKNSEMIQLLLSHNININYSKKIENSPLIITIKENDIISFQIIIDYINSACKHQQLDEMIKNIIQYSKNINDFNILKFIHKYLNRKSYSNYDNLNDIITKNDKNYNVKACKDSQPLHYGCMEGNIFDILNIYAFRKNDFDINQRNNDGSTPIMVAVKNGNYECIELLFKLYSNLDINIADYKNMTPLMYMLENKVDKVDIYMILIKNGAYIPLEYIQSNSYFYMTLNYDEFIKYIIKNGFMVNDKGNIKNITNILKYSIEVHNEILLKVLINKGIEYKKENCNGKQPILYAIEQNNEEAVSLLMKHMNNEEIKNLVNNIIFNSFNTKKCDILIKLKGKEYINDSIISNIIEDASKNINYYKSNGYEPLHEACKNNNINLLNNLLLCHYDINTKSKKTNETPIIVALKNRKYDIVNKLLEYDNININYCDNNQQSPIFIMINDKQSENTKIFEKLITHNVNTLEKYKGDTPLLLSIKKKKNEYVRILLQYQTTDINELFSKNMTLMNYMIDNIIDNEYAFDLLLKRGAYIDSKYINDNKLIKLFEKNKGLIKAVINNGFIIKNKTSTVKINYPLIHLIKGSKNNLVENFLKYGASVEETDEDGFTPIFHTVRSNNSKIFFLLLDKYNADINKTTKNGQTLLNYAKKKKIQLFITELNNRKTKNSSNINTVNDFNESIKNIIKLDSYLPLDNKTNKKSKVSTSKENEQGKVKVNNDLKTKKTSVKKNNKTNNKNKQKISNKLVIEKPQTKSHNIENIYDISSYLNFGKMINIKDNTKESKSLILLEEESNEEELNFSSDLSSNEDYLSDFIYEECMSVNNNNSDLFGDEDDEDDNNDENDFMYYINNINDNNSSNSDTEKIQYNDYNEAYEDNIINKYPELHYACLKESEEFINMLINNFMYDINEPCNDGSTPLLLSVKHKKYNSIRILLKNKANIKKQDNQGESPISFILKNPSKDNLKILKLFIPYIKIKETYPPNNLTPLNYLIRYNNIEGIKVLLESNKSIINEIDNNGDTILLSTLKNNISNKELIETLLLLGANPDQLDTKGKTPLIYAIEKRDYDLIRLLIKYNANIELKISSGITPLKLAIKCNDITIAKELLNSKRKMK
ncbi:ankyrin [Piromyces finnis]|uniref:Ankyrin n=1 Tax=Piromyces finnis TaxID=1754191 RepID=A0A1Y1VA36_9FUNG|nr:ankyrin [Piromyces finnis]|eukprot:ORX50363.1 ankyrin [Piromyces finnis]